MRRIKTYQLFFPGIFALCLLPQSLFAQSAIDSLFNKVNPQRFAGVVESKVARLESKLADKSMRVLEKLQRQEEKIYTKVLKSKDSILARIKLAELKEKYEQKRNLLKQPFDQLRITKITGSYLPRFDSLTTSLKFLDAVGISGKIKEALSKTTALQDKFRQAEEIKKFIRERKAQLKQQLEKLGIVKEMKKINKQIYYYSAQIREYKEMLNDPDKIERKVLELLSKTKWFQDFFKRNSMLASIFPISGGQENSGTGQSGFAGLQTRAQVTTFIQQANFNTALNSSSLQQNIQNVQAQLSQLRSKLGGLTGNSGDDLDMPDFKFNSQKTKSFFKRLEYGTNIQSQKANNFLPTTTDVGLSIGYKINDKSTIGIGTSYKIGWGLSWDNIRMSSEGISLRSFIDLKIKNSWWISGGYEQNYKASFNRIDVLKDLSAWKRSGLIGMSKTVSLKSKFLKSTKVQLLWDFLSNTQKPKTQPLVFRIGYSFK